MAKPTDFTQDTKLDEMLKQQKQQDFEDCYPCRLVGATAFIGLGTYTYWSGRKQLYERELEILRSGSRVGIGARRAGLVGLSVILVSMGAYRMFN